MTLRKAILHIGTEKTGSTAIQAWLAGNKALLARHGYRPCKSAGSPNNRKLAAYAMDHAEDGGDGVLNAPFHTLQGLRDTLAADLAREVAAAPARTMILSSEHCHSRLITVDEVRRLHALLIGVFDEVRVIVYIRRQDRLAVSLYSTAIKNGHSRPHIIPIHGGLHPFYDYQQLLDRWATVFGKDAITVKLFEPSAFPGGSIISSFAEHLGFEAVDGGPRSNESLDRRHQEFMRLMNMRLRPSASGPKSPAVKFLAKYVSSRGSGRGRLPARADAEAFYSRHREGNEAVRRQWFPEREHLFDEDFSDYPDVGDPIGLSETEAFDIMAGAWTAAIAKSERLAAKVTELKRLLAEAQTKSLS